MYKLLLLFIIFTNITFSQTDSVLFEANIKNEQFEPLSYVNIDFIEKGKNGTVSDKQGYFSIKCTLDDTLVINHVKYKKIYCPVGVLMANDTFNMFQTIILTNKYIEEETNITEFEELTVTAKKKKVRYRNYGSKSTDKAMALGVESDDLGYEFGTKINVPHRKNVKLQQFNCYVISSTIDSIKFRINIYQFNDLDSTFSIIYDNYIITSKTDAGKLNFDFSNENIYLKDDILLSLEIIDVFGNGSLYFSTRTIGSGTYFRTGKEAEWEKFPIIAVAFNIDVKLF